jgi:predicted RNA-binding protein (virulence factor B family)
MQLHKHLVLGEMNILRVDRDTSPGLFLMAEDGKDVLLPGQYITKDMQIDSLVEVFLYTDSEDRLVATTTMPKALLDEYALFEVVDTTSFGAFVDWGLSKDLFVPKMFQKTPFLVGEKRFLKVVYDEKTHRLVGTEKIASFFNKKVKGLHQTQEVDILIISKTKLGFKCIVNNQYEGLIYHNEVFEKISLGDSKKAFIKNIRKDGGIDLSLRKPNSKQSGSSSERILQLLQENNGSLPYNYKTDPELIKEVFSLSKKDFKRSLTTLVESGKIVVKDTGIYLHG